MSRPRLRKNRPASLVVTVVVLLLAYLGPRLEGWMQDNGFSGAGETKGSSARDAADVRGYPKLRDGDSFDIGSTRVRLHGVDAFEGKQSCPRAGGGTFACGERGRDALRKFIDGREVFCQRRDTDPYGRMVARCSVAGQDLGRYMVEQGWALAYRQFSRDYVRYEDQARKAGRGVWAEPGFTNPWQWRSQQRRG